MMRVRRAKLVAGVAVALGLFLFTYMFLDPRYGMKKNIFPTI